MGKQKTKQTKKWKTKKATAREGESEKKPEKQTKQLNKKKTERGGETRTLSLSFASRTVATVRTRAADRAALDFQTGKGPVNFQKQK